MSSIASRSACMSSTVARSRGARPPTACRCPAAKPPSSRCWSKRRGTARHLVASYGSEAAAVLNLVDRDRRLGEPVLPGRPEIWAEVTYAVEREMAVRVQDVLIRRLHLFYEVGDHGQSVVPKVTAQMKQLLGWDDAREAEELRDYFQMVERGRVKA